MALRYLAPGSRGRCVRPNDLAALWRGRAPRGVSSAVGGAGGVYPYVGHTLARPGKAEEEKRGGTNDLILFRTHATLYPERKVVS